MMRVVLFVGDKHYAVWDSDIPRHNRQCLRSFDSAFFEYLAAVHSRPAGKRRRQQAAVALRMSYGLALETLFAVLAAAVQAPSCIYAWLDLYWPKDLEAVVQCIQGQGSVPHLMRRPLSWGSVAEAVHACVKPAETEWNSQLVAHFANFWTRCATDFLANDEYNAVKHGMRIQPGGFRIELGPELRPGERARTEDMRTIGASEFGGTRLRTERINDSNRDRRIVLESRAWDPPSLAGRLRLIAMSLANVVSFLRIVNGEPPQRQRFTWPRDLAVFEQVWPPMSPESFSMGVAVEHAKRVTRAEVEAVYRGGR